MPTRVDVVMQRYRQLTVDSRHNRQRPTHAKAQQLALEQAFGNYADAWGAIRATDEWALLDQNTPMHPDQLRAFAEGFECGLTPGR